jgi:hypothetical protein
MKKLSTGDDSTLGNWRKLSVAVFGEDSNIIPFLDDKIYEAPNGENEEVIVDEAQMLHVLMSIHMEGSHD